MARAAARKRRPQARDTGSTVSSRVVRESAGVALLGMALLLLLALASFSPDDPVFESAQVANRAGVLGASASALLFGFLGAGAWVAVAGLGFLAARLVLGLGMPPLASRFWAAAALLLVAAATLPPLLDSAFPGSADLPAGALGRTLAGGESRVFYRPAGSPRSQIPSGQND